MLQLCTSEKSHSPPPFFLEQKKLHNIFKMANAIQLPSFNPSTPLLLHIDQCPRERPWLEIQLLMSFLIDFPIVVVERLSAKVCFPLSEHQKNGSFVPLEEVDASSVVLGEVTMLNTLKHYQVRNLSRFGISFSNVSRLSR